MSEPGKHHYLPVFYLERWRGVGSKVYRYYRPHDVVVVSDSVPDNTGYERSLYALQGFSPEGPNVIEKGYMAPVVDQQAADAIRALLDHRDLNLTPDIRIDWTRFVMALKLRNPEAIAMVNQEGARIVRDNLLDRPEEYSAIRPEGFPPTMLEFALMVDPAILVDFGKRLLPNLIENPEIGNMIIKMRWWTLEFPNSRFDLLTCDNPLILTHALADDRCVLAVPLSPRAVFIATRRIEAIERIRSHGTDTIVTMINSSIVQQAHRNVYGATKSHLRFVENRLKRLGVG